MKRQHVLLLGFLSLIFTTSQLHGATFTWDGGGANGDFSTAANWNPDVAPGTIGSNNFIFGPLVASLPQTTANVNLGGNPGTFTFANTLTTPMTLTGNLLQLGPAAVGTVITNNSSQLQTISNDIHVFQDLTFSAASGNLALGNIFFRSDGTFPDNKTLTLTGSANGSIGPLANFVTQPTQVNGISKTGTGTWTLNGNNTYTGATNVNAGTLNLFGTSANLSASTTVTVASGGHLRFSPDGSFSGPYNYNSFDLNLTGQGADTDPTHRTVYFGNENVNTYNLPGDITVAGGVQFYTFGIQNTINLGGEISGTGDISFVSAGAGFHTFEFSGDSSATGYTGTLIFNAVEPSVQPTSVVGKLSGGDNRLPIGATVSLQPTAGASATLDLNGNNQEIAGLINGGGAGGAFVRNSGGGTPTLTINNSGTNIFSGELGTGGANFALDKKGAGLLILSGDNSYNGGTDVQAGILRIDNGASLGSGAVNVADGASLILWTPNAMTVANDITLNGMGPGVGRPALNQDGGGGLVTLNGTITLAATSDIGTGGLSWNDLVINGKITGPGGLIVDMYSGTTHPSGPDQVLSLAGNNDFTGDLVLKGGELRALTANALGSGNNLIFADDSTLRPGYYAGGTTFAQGVTVNPGVTATFESLNQFYKMTFTNPLTGSGDIVVSSSDNGNGAVTFSNATNTFTGGVQVGTATYGASLTVNSLADSAQPIQIYGTTARPGYFALGTGTAAPLVFNNRQIELLGGAGTAVINNNNGSAANTITINTDLKVSATGDKNLTLGGGNFGANTFAGKIADGTSSVISLNKAGTGTWVLSGANTYGGATDIQAGILRIQNNTALGAGGFSATTWTLVKDGATLEFDGNLNVNEHMHVEGAGAGGIGALHALSGSSTVTQNMALDANTTIGADAGASLEIAATIYPNGGTPGITKIGDGTLIFSDNNIYGGDTNVNAGTLQLAAGSQQNANVFVNGTSTLQHDAGTNNVTASGAGTHLTVASGAAYNLAGGELTFGDLSSTDQTAVAGNGASTMQIDGTFAFSGGVLSNLERIEVAPGVGKFTVGDMGGVGARFVIGTDGVSSPGTAERAITTIAQTTGTTGINFELLSDGTLALDIFGPGSHGFNGESGGSLSIDPLSASLDSDLLHVTGDADLAGILDINTNSFGLAPFAWYDVLLADGTIDTDGLTLAGGATFFRVIDSPFGAGQLLQVAVPEPTAVSLWLLLGVMVGGGMYWRRRRAA